MGESYYELLGVPEDASTEEIERAYREKLKETHPDVSDDEDASERTKHLIDAKETLTDETERERYDRLGHESYVERESAATGGHGTGGTDTASRSGDTRSKSGDTSNANSTGASATGGQTADATSSSATAGSAGRQSTASTRQSQGRVREDSWHQQSRTNNDVSGSAEEGAWHAWSSKRAYAVERGEDAQRFGGALTSQRAFVLLGSTFVVYPVLLFGALGDVFPLPVNLLVAMCVVLVIAFMQSIPEVGIVVFGIWTVLLPVLLFGWIGTDPLAFRSIVAIVAVIFPLGLSVLTRIAIRPMTAS